MKRFALFAFIAMLVPASAANVPITGLPTASIPLTGDEVVPCVQNGATSRCQASSLLGVQIQNIQASSYSFDCPDFYQLTRRSAVTGSPLSDTLPGLPNACVRNGAWLRISNVGSATDTVTAGTGTTFTGGGSSDTIQGGRSVTYAYDAANAVWRAIDNTSKAGLTTATNTWSATQTFSVAPVYTDQAGTRNAIGLGEIKTPLVANSSVAQTTNTTIYYPCAGSSDGGSATESDVFSLMPYAGTMSVLYVYTNALPAIGQNYAATVRKNGADGTLTCAIANPTPNCSDSASGHAMTFAMGDRCTVKVVFSATAGSGKIYNSEEYDWP